MGRVAEHVVRRAGLDDEAVAQHDDVVAQVVDDAEVVGHEDQAEPVRRRRAAAGGRGSGPAPTRRARSTGSSPTSSAGRGAIARAMAMRCCWPAGELVGVAVPPRRVEADRLEDLGDAGVVVARHVEAHERFADDRRDRHPRVERAERVLEDDLGLPPEPAQLAGPARRDHAGRGSGPRPRWPGRARAGSAPASTCPIPTRRRCRGWRPPAASGRRHPAPSARPDRRTATSAAAGSAGGCPSP